MSSAHAPDAPGATSPGSKLSGLLAELGQSLAAPFRSPRPWRELLTAFKDDVQQQLSSLFSLMLLGAYLLFTLVMTLPYVGLSGLIARELAKKDESGTAAAGLSLGVSQGMSHVFTQVSGSSSEGLAMAAIPLPVLYTYFLLAAFLPLLALLLSADLMADDLRTGHIRYLALRAGRGSLLFGRLLARGLLLALTVLLASAACYGIFLWKLDSLAPSSYEQFLRFAGLLVAMACAYLGLASLCTTLVRGALLALVLGLLGEIFLLALAASETLGWLSPVSYLLHFGPERLPVAITAYLGFAAVFAAAAWLRLRTRDL